MIGVSNRISFNTLPSTLSVFPLEGALLLPRARLPLNIFEPRYLAMLDETLRSDHRLIGMVQPREHSQPTGQPPLYTIGCAGRVMSFSETDDGRYLISLTGVSRFEIIEEIEGFTPFRRVRPDWSRFEQDIHPCVEENTAGEKAQMRSLLCKYFEAMDLSADWESLSRADDETLINTMAMLCPFSPREKQALLEAENLAARKEGLKALMEFAIAEARLSREMQ